jgi:broad specificity phosphatase PhoE
LKRALETARIIARYHDVPLHIDYSFKELEVGRLEGMELENLTSDFSRYLMEWRKGQGTERLPGGESLSDLRDRAWSAVQHIVDTHNGTVMLVSHYFIILTVICAALGMPLTGLRRFRIQAASVSIIDFENGKPCLSLLGDTCHLNGG